MEQECQSRSEVQATSRYLHPCFIYLFFFLFHLSLLFTSHLCWLLLHLPPPPLFSLLNGRSFYLTPEPVALFNFSCSAASFHTMAVVKLLTSTLLFYILNSLRDYWYPLIQWAVNWIVIASISWYIGRRITRYFICQKILPRVEPSDKAVLISGEKWIMTMSEINKYITLIYFSSDHIFLFVLEFVETFADDAFDGYSECCWVWRNHSWPEAQTGIQRKKSFYNLT